MSTTITAFTSYCLTNFSIDSSFTFNVLGSTSATKTSAPMILAAEEVAMKV